MVRERRLRAGPSRALRGVNGLPDGAGPASAAALISRAGGVILTSLRNDLKIFRGGGEVAIVIRAPLRCARPAAPTAGLGTAVTTCTAMGPVLAPSPVGWEPPGGATGPVPAPSLSPFLPPSCA